MFSPSGSQAEDEAEGRLAAFTRWSIVGRVLRQRRDGHLVGFGVDDHL
jgi:hypothetical protein